ncbi:nuclear transport factor 2 family protein [Streptomyces sp. 3214.6]|uniref:nuclear transport factor 2 family protein n=1 Tax=Streptomyces sp. 3214.6 TaxID=1882757 RepID=UPI00090C0F2B|nr:nuclear transport factor 2 family protein [Streptomyces sp. 3214.6]SHI14089.1 SnoaL-like domain-containing protein [Streptomyces sp. 3214.6]
MADTHRVSGGPEDVVEAAFRHYRAQDRDAALPLYADDFTFTSPYDDHIDKAAFFERCFPTADRMTEQRLLRVTPADAELVFAYYEYVLATGARHRNVEAITVRDGLIREVQVFFGGQV